MHRKNMIPFVLAMFILVLTAAQARAQSETPKVEASAVFTAIRQNDDFYRIVREFDWRVRHNYGFGGRLTFNLTEHIAVEGEITYHPKERSLGVGGLFPPENFGVEVGGTRTQGLFGAKVGKRFDKFGVFAKARPGFMRYSRVPNCPEGDVSRCTEGARTEFAFDIGGAFEYYPTSRFVVRFDAGDTIIRHRELTRANFGGLPPTPNFPLEVGGGTTHNAQYSVAFGVRF